LAGTQGGVLAHGVIYAGVRTKEQGRRRSTKKRVRTGTTPQDWGCKRAKLATYQKKEKTATTNRETQFLGRW